MLVLVMGSVVFFAIHLVPSNVALREGLIARFGLTGYKAIFGIVSLVGFVPIVIRFAKLQVHPGKNPQIWVAPLWTRSFAHPHGAQAFDAGRHKDLGTRAPACQRRTR